MIRYNKIALNMMVRRLPTIIVVTQYDMVTSLYCDALTVSLDACALDLRCFTRLISSFFALYMTCAPRHACMVYMVDMTNYPGSARLYPPTTRPGCRN